MNTKQGGCAAPKNRICTGRHPRFPQETAAGSYKTFTASSPQRKKIQGMGGQGQEGKQKSPQGTEAPSLGSGGPQPHIRRWGTWALLSPLRLGGLGAQGTKGNK